ncbi:MAG TPA: hypothetical protein VGG04_16650 [Candidatus Sulfotelmatobacter sp.]
MTTRNRSPFAKLLFSAILSALLLLPAALGSRDALLAAQKSKKEEDKPYAVIFGTVWGPDDRPIYGVTVHIRLSTDKPKKVRWQVFSDHHGEFAQRVPAGEADYILTADLKHAKFSDGKTLRLPKDVTVHIYNDEREDTGLHLTY